MTFFIGICNVNYTIFIRTTLVKLICRHIIGNCSFPNKIGLFYTVLVCRKTIPLSPPFFCLGNSLFVTFTHMGTICSQMKFNACGKSTCITIMHPSFFCSNGNSFRLIGNNISISSTTSNHACFIGIYLILSDGILDLISVFKLCKLCKCMFPVVCSRQPNRFNLLSISIKPNDHSVRTIAESIFAIIPHLCYSNLCFFNLMFIRHIVTVNNGCILGSCFFRDSVVHFLASRVFGQISECPFPAIRSSHNLRLKYLTICKKIDGYAFRPLSVPVIIIVPSLGAGDCDSFGGIGICDIVTVNICFITCNSILSDGIVNFYTIFVLISFKRP